MGKTAGTNGHYELLRRCGKGRSYREPTLRWTYGHLGSVASAGGYRETLRYWGDPPTCPLKVKELGVTERSWPSATPAAKKSKRTTLELGVFTSHLHASATEASASRGWHGPGGLSHLERGVD